MDRDPARLTAFPRLQSSSRALQRLRLLLTRSSRDDAGTGPEWIADRFVTHCRECGVAFSAIRRKHHCRLCGLIFCHECSAFQVRRGRLKDAARACRSCYAEFHGMEETASEHDIEDETSCSIVSPSHESANSVPPTPRLDVTLTSSEMAMDSELIHLNAAMEDSGTEFDAVVEECTALRRVYDHHLDMILEQSLHDVEAAWTPKPLQRWRDLILGMAASFVDTVKLKENNCIDDALLFRAFPGDEAALNETRHIQGLWIEKSLAHTRMKKAIADPRILLFSCALEFERHHQLSSLDSVWKQEDEYFSIIAKKLVRLNPDLILVEKSVAGKLMNRLVDAGIAVAVGLGPRWIELVSHAVGCRPLSSAEHVDQFAQSHIIGTCGSFCTQRIDNTFYLCFEECIPSQIITILLHGGSLNALQQMETVIRRCVEVAYNSKCEEAFFLALGVTFSDLIISSCTSGHYLGGGISSSPFVDIGSTPPTDSFDVARTNSISSMSDIVGYNYQHDSIADAFHCHLMNELIISRIQLSAVSRKQCKNPNVKLYRCYDPEHDETLYSFLQRTCFCTQWECESKQCKASLEEHKFRYVHAHSYLDIRVRKLQGSIPRHANKTKILCWLFCPRCNRIVVPPRELPRLAERLSFGKFLELLFYVHDGVIASGSCKHTFPSNHILFFADHTTICRVRHYQSRVFEMQHVSMHKTPSGTLEGNEPIAAFLDLIDTALERLLADCTGAPRRYEWLELFRTKTNGLLHELHRINTVEKQHRPGPRNVYAQLQRQGIKGKYLNALRAKFDDVFQFEPSRSGRIAGAGNDGQWTRSLSRLFLRALEELELPTYDSAMLCLETGTYLVPHPFLENCSNRVQESSPGSIIAHTLSSIEYAALVTNSDVQALDQSQEEKQRIFARLDPELGSLLGLADFCIQEHDDTAMSNLEVAMVSDEEVDEIEPWIGAAESRLDTSQLKKSKGRRGSVPVSLLEMLVSGGEPEFKHQFIGARGSVSTAFYCSVFFPRQFRALRQHDLGSDHDFLAALSQTEEWITTGGKSGSAFTKSLDDRFVIKCVKKREFKAFLRMAHAYFQYMKSVIADNCPSMLVRVYGIYKITHSRSTGQKAIHRYVIIMPNSLFNVSASRIFDLKGTTRNRFAKIEKKRVLLDENFIEYTSGFPTALSPQSRDFFQMAIHNDTLFFSRQDIVDYSILVALDDKSNHIWYGIIDYLRQYAWAEQIETGVKSLGRIAGKDAPTVIDPRKYMLRFRQAMKRYFIVAPTRYTKAM